MKLAVLSDIHGNLIALEATLADLESVGEVDKIWILGDLAAFGSRPVECIRRVQALKDEHGKDKVDIIGGNTDRYMVTGERLAHPAAKDEETFKQLVSNFSQRDLILNWNREHLAWEDYEFLTKILHKELALHAEGYGHVIGYHAIPGDDEAMLTAETSDEEALDALLDREGRLGIGGHIHKQMNRDLGRWRVVNVGSIGMSFDMPGKAQWGLFTFEDGSVSVELRAVSYDVDAVIDEMQAVGHPAPGWVTRWFGRR
jgi:predicted phosphodiesterase